MVQLSKTPWRAQNVGQHSRVYHSSLEGTTAVPLIQKYIVKHLNKGKRNKLTKKVEVDDEDE